MEEGMEIQNRAEKEIEDQKKGQKEEKLELVNYRDGDPNPGSARDPIVNNDGAYDPGSARDPIIINEGAYASNDPLSMAGTKRSLGDAFTTAR